MTFTLASLSKNDREYAKFDVDNTTGSAILVKVALYAYSGTNWLPVQCLSDGTLLTSGA